MTSFLLSLRESIEIAFQILLLLNILGRHKRFIYIASVTSLILGTGMAIYLFPPDIFITKTIIGLAFLFYIFILLLSMTNISEIFIIPVVTLFFLSHSFQLTSVIMDRAILSGRSVYLYSLSAIMFTVFVFYLVNRYILERINLRQFMNPQEMLLFITSVNIITGGNRDFNDASPIPFLQEHLRVFITGFLEVSRKLLLLPDTSTFDTPLRTIFDFLTSQRFFMAIISFTILIPPVYLLLKLLTSPEPEMEGMEKKAIIRKKIALYRTELLKRGTPIMFSFVSFIILIHGANLIINPVYEPQPVNIISEGNLLKIPLTDSTGDISDQRLRKYVFVNDGVSYRLIVMMRPDGEVVATLDACEICPPRGYIQKGRYLICKYCNTPIPSESFGLSGGCNPIPVPYRIEGDNLLLNVVDVMEVSKKAGSKFTGRH